MATLKYGILDGQTGTLAAAKGKTKPIRVCYHKVTEDPDNWKFETDYI